MPPKVLTSIVSGSAIDMTRPTAVSVITVDTLYFNERIKTK